MLSILSPQGAGAMPEKTPYRLQVFLSNELREALREIAYKERLSLQRLIVRWLLEKARGYPEGQHLPSPETV